jgi:putative hydrolase of the HAD superfamily
MNKKIEAIIFDLGGVLYEVDVQRSMEAFGRLGLKNFDRFYTLKEQTALFDRLETGKIDDDEFAAHINRYSEAPLSKTQVTEAWNALLLGMRPEIPALLEKIRSKYPVYLLSNTNSFHLNFIDEEMKEQFGLPDLRCLFDRAYYSFEIGMRKPGREIYDHVIRENNLDPGTTLFLDDNADNVKGALSAGILALQMERNGSLEDALTQAGVII